MADSTTMTIDFLRARLLSERSVSRAAKERTDELAKRVAELEEQVRDVIAQRRQAERAAAEVLAILESQLGFGSHLSVDADDDSGSDHDGDEEEEEDEKSRGGTVRAPGDEEEESAAAAHGQAEDAMSGTAHHPGGLSWKGRSVSPRKARQQLKQKSRRSYFYMLSSSGSSPPKYRMGQSCRKNKRQMVMSDDGRSVSPGEDDAVAAECQKGRQDGSDCAYDGQDGEAGGEERSSRDGGGGQYVIRYEKDGEMDRMLERQAELIEQYEEEEKAQREWEKQYNENRNTDQPCQNREGWEEDSNPGASQGAPCGGKVLPKGGSLSGSPQNTSQENRAQLRKVNDQSCPAQESSNTSSTVTTRQHEITDGDSCFNNGNARRRRPRHRAINTPSDRGSPSSDTLRSKVSDWSSSSHFHDHTVDSHLDDAQSHRPTSSSSSGSSMMDVWSVLEALQRARISLSAKLLPRPVPLPPSQVTLALPAPGDDLLKECDDDGDSGSYGEERGSSSSPRRRQEILALPAPDDYNGRVDSPVINDTGISVTENSSSSNPLREEILALPAPGDEYRREMDEYANIPVRVPGLFRLPTDSFPADQRMFGSGNVRGSGFSLGAAATRPWFDLSLSGNPGSVATSSANRNRPATTEAPSTTSGDGSGFSSAPQRFDLYSSVPTAGRCNNNSISGPEFTIRDSSFGLSGVAGLGDADLFMQRGIDYTISDKWML